MHTYEKWYRDETWQRVVTSPLSSDELRELIAACEARPELWRCCAMAFLEEQALAGELKQLATEWPQPQSQSQSRHEARPDSAASVASAAGSLSSLSTSLSQSPSSQSPSSQSSSSQSSSSQSLSSATGHRSQDAPAYGVTHARAPDAAHNSGAAHASLLNNLALAATILVAFMAGWQASRRFGHSADWTLTTDNRAAVVALGQAQPSQVKQPSPAARPAGRASAEPSVAGAGKPQLAVASPSASESSLDAIQQALLQPERMLLLDRRIPTQLAELEQRGLVSIEAMEGLVPVQLNNGNTALVPVQQFDVRSTGKMIPELVY